MWEQTVTFAFVLWPPPCQAAARDEGGGKRARGCGSMEALVFALLDEWPGSLDLGAPPYEAYAAE